MPYVYVKPVEGTLGDEGAFELKNTWVVRRDGLLFGSGWYINTEEFVPQLISESAEHFSSGGLEAVLEFYNDPQGISAGHRRGRRPHRRRLVPQLRRGGRSMKGADCFHHLYHRYFECNYGNRPVPLDTLSGTFHDGTPEAHVRMRERREDLRGHCGVAPEPQFYSSSGNCDLRRRSW